MLNFNRTVSLAGAAVLAVTLGAAVAPANAKSSAASAPCTLDLGSVTAAGAQTSRTITATTPVTVGPVTTTTGVYQPGQVKHISTFRDVPALQSGRSRSGLVVMGGALYSTKYGVTANGQVDPKDPVVHRRIGGGWSAYRWIEQSVHTPVTSTPTRTTLYGQETIGYFHRWNLEGTSWRHTGEVSGLAVVKSMTLINRSYSHDTFLTNTRAGKLMTILIPRATPMRPTGTPVRDSTWQVFEQLIATRCGADGSLVLGIDRDTKTAYLYTVSHLTGTSTAIRNLGKVPGSFADPHYFRWAPEVDTLNG